MKFSIGSMIGTVISLAMILFGVMETIKVTQYTDGINTQFMNIPSLVIVVGGVLMASYITFQSRYVNKALAGVRYFLVKQVQTKNLSKKTLNQLLNGMMKSEKTELMH